MKTVSCCRHGVQEAVYILALVHIGFGRFLVWFLTNGVNDGLVLLARIRISRLSISEPIFEFLAFVTPYVQL